MIQEPVRVQLEMESLAENVALIRAALTGFAEASELTAESTSDLKTAVSEACNNVVLHAYDGAVGPMLVRIEATSEIVEVTVTDNGHGIRRISGGDEHMGLGLAVISSLADRAEFRNPKDGGTEVTMCFRNDGSAVVADPEYDDAVEDGERWPDRTDAPDLAGQVVTWISPVELGRFVLGRVFRAIAAASQFSVARFSDLYAVNEAIAEYAELAADDGLSVSISSASRMLSVTGGPFVPPVPGTDDGGAVTPERAREIASRRQSLAAVVDGLQTERVGEDQELLHLTLVDSSRDWA